MPHLARQSSRRPWCVEGRPAESTNLGGGRSLTQSRIRKRTSVRERGSTPTATPPRGDGASVRGTPAVFRLPRPVHSVCDGSLAAPRGSVLPPPPLSGAHRASHGVSMGQRGVASRRAGGRRRGACPVGWLAAAPMGLRGTGEGRGVGKRGAPKRPPFACAGAHAPTPLRSVRGRPPDLPTRLPPATTHVCVPPPARRPPLAARVRP